MSTDAVESVLTEGNQTMPASWMSLALTVAMQVGQPSPSETPNYPPLQNAFSRNGFEGEFEQRYPFDNQQNWTHGYFQEIPAYGGHTFYRPYNYKDILSQSQTAAGWGASPVLPYSQQFWHRYNDQATMLKLSQNETTPGETSTLHAYGMLRPASSTSQQPNAYLPSTAVPADHWGGPMPAAYPGTPAYSTAPAYAPQSAYHSGSAPQMFQPQPVLQAPSYPNGYQSPGYQQGMVFTAGSLQPPALPQGSYAPQPAPTFNVPPGYQLVPSSPAGYPTSPAYPVQEFAPAYAPSGPALIP